VVNSLSLRERAGERAGERGAKKETTFKIPPHPNLLPQGRRDSKTNLMALGLVSFI